MCSSDLDKTFWGRDNVFARIPDIFTLQKRTDDIRARGCGSQTGFVHIVRQFLIRIRGSGQRFPVYKAASRYRQLLLPKKFRGYGTEVVVFRDKPFPLKDTEPPRFQNTVCTDSELACGTDRFNRRIFHLAGRHERFKHPADNKGVNQPFLPVQFPRLYAGDDNGMMLRRVLISGYAFPCSKVDHTGILTEFLAGQQLFHNRRQHVIHVSGQQTAGSARAGDQFFLVQALGNFLHPYGCQVMVTVRILLKPGQVIKGRCGDFLSPRISKSR